MTPAYMSGFGNSFESEALPGTLPVGRNSPQKIAYGLYAEQLSGSPFTAPRSANQRSWLYRIRPSVRHMLRFGRVDHGAWRSAPDREEADLPLGQLRWAPVPIPERTDLTFVSGLRTVTTAGDALAQTGMAAHLAFVTASMRGDYLSNADGELLIVAQQGALRFCTEFGLIEIAPGEIAVIPRGVIFKVELPGGPARAYVCENYGGAFTLPERGPIGANCLANPRDFQTPVAAYEDVDGPGSLFVKWGGRLHRSALHHSPLDVVAWHGNYAPYKYDLRHFSPVGALLFDHPDPSIFTVLTAPSETPGTANVDFVIFPDRWMVAENTFRPPWYHRNIMSELMGLVYGVYDAKPGGFKPGGLSLHNMMLPHGPDTQAFERASHEELRPVKQQGTMAFMFETRFAQLVTPWAAGLPELERDYADCWADLAKNFDPSPPRRADMAVAVDASHDPDLRSWVASADGHPDFPIQNLPLGIFAPDRAAPRAGVAIGDRVLDLAGLAAAGLLPVELGPLVTATDLNPLLAAGEAPRRSLRARLGALLARGAAERGRVEALLHCAADCAMHLPATIGDYTDFYAGIHHARHVGRLFRPENPLLPNYAWLPVAYHGRASTVRPSGLPVRRPSGQVRPRAGEAPAFGPTRELDFELEIAVWLGPGNQHGEPVAIADAWRHIAGFGLLNDWSARDIQAWEYQPLGPFLAKSFHTTVSPWIVTPEALAPFRIAQEPRGEGEPAALAHLDDADDRAGGALSIALEVSLVTAAMREASAPAHRLTRTAARHLYWTVAQMVAHHASNGCALRPGDLFGSGTISGPTPDLLGSLLEITEGGSRPVAVGAGEQRRFLEDGDEVIVEARAHGGRAVPIGFGACRARVVAGTARAEAAGQARTAG